MGFVAADLSEEGISPVLGKFRLGVSGIEDETERIIALRSMLLGYYAQMKKKKPVIGCFRQRLQDKYNHAIEFSNKLDMIFGIETIYCVKDSSVITNIRSNGEVVV